MLTSRFHAIGDVIRHDGVGRFSKLHLDGNILMDGGRIFWDCPDAGAIHLQTRRPISIVRREAHCDVGAFLHRITLGRLPDLFTIVESRTITQSSDRQVIGRHRYFFNLHLDRGVCIDRCLVVVADRLADSVHCQALDSTAFVCTKTDRDVCAFNHRILFLCLADGIPVIRGRAIARCLDGQGIGVRRNLLKLDF